ncbi:hypothetical protein RND71_031091 [Anisodus tanguticus]|uniref:Sorting nexin 1 n=1 Tax=Anisodus tanguticus TaxID=243964 RepID=A0AAE1RBU0_9SOLA|nr:hypothetical protein RND71_031091 [Anisodus tanguticus]
MRRQALDVFVNRIASHHELRQSDDLRTFLQADEQTMDRARFQETGCASKVSDVVLGKEKLVEELTPEYEKMKSYIFELEDHLAEAQKHAFRLVKRHRVRHMVIQVPLPSQFYLPCSHPLRSPIAKLLGGVILYLRPLTKWADLLTNLRVGRVFSEYGKAVKLLGTCEDDAVGKAFSELGAKSEIISIKLQKEAHHLLMNFEEPFKDYVRAVQSIKATIAERATAFKKQCELAETIKFKEIDLNKYRLTRSEKLAEAEREEEASRRFDTIVRLMNEEIVRFQEQKTSDMGLAFHEFAKGQARLSNGIADVWRGLLPKLEACSS